MQATSSATVTPAVCWTAFSVWGNKGKMTESLLSCSLHALGRRSTSIFQGVVSAGRRMRQSEGQTAVEVCPRPYITKQGGRGLWISVIIMCCLAQALRNQRQWSVQGDSTGGGQGSWLWSEIQMGRKRVDICWKNICWMAFQAVAGSGAGVANRGQQSSHVVGVQGRSMSIRK